jgi:hypothetical protein
MSFSKPTFVESCGLMVGSWLAPLTAAVSAKRQARMFHPDGVVYRASVSACVDARALSSAATRLAGTALVRFSSALWREGHEWPDVLGAAIRFEGAAEQDLLLATIRFPWTMPFAPLATRFHSFAWNHYHAVSPFELDGVGPVKLRLRSPRIANDSGKPREQHLLTLASAGRARFVLECRLLAVAPLARRWEPLVNLELTRPAKVDQQALRFSPFRDGAGIHPTGFVHALRLGAYGASQSARPQREADAPHPLGLLSR